MENKIITKEFYTIMQVIDRTLSLSNEESNKHHSIKDNIKTSYSELLGSNCNDILLEYILELYNTMRTEMDYIKIKYVNFYKTRVLELINLEELYTNLQEQCAVGSNQEQINTIQYNLLELNNTKKQKSEAIKNIIVFWNKTTQLSTFIDLYRELSKLNLKMNTLIEEENNYA